MTDPELLDAISRKAGVSQADARAVLTALSCVVRESVRAGEHLPIDWLGLLQSGERFARPGTGHVPAAPYVPTPDEIARLIAAASNHPLGVEFLLQGDLCAVAITFGVHAFTVEAAREEIRQHGAVAGPSAHG